VSTGEQCTREVPERALFRALDIGLDELDARFDSLVHMGIEREGEGRVRGIRGVVVVVGFLS
jgi:hypothetical protein